MLMALSGRSAAPAPSDTPTQNLYKTRFSDEDFDVPKNAAAKTGCSGSSVGRPSQEQAGAPGPATDGTCLAKDSHIEAAEYVVASLELVVARLDKMQEQMDRDRLCAETHMKKMEVFMKSLMPLAEKRTPHSPDGEAVTFDSPKTIDAKALSAFSRRSTEEFKIGKPARCDTRELPGFACRFGFIASPQPEMDAPFS